MISKQNLLDKVEENRDEIIHFLRGFIAAKSPNPPGDTRDAAAYVTSYLKSIGINYSVLGPDIDKPNIISSLHSPTSGKALTLNGHMDVFPVGDGEGWTQDPWGGNVVGGRIYGRGACDMKAGTTASLFTYIFLHEFREDLGGRATLTVVSDEESGGKLGSGWVVDNIPEAIGDCCINGEPSSPYTLRFGEKGILWIKVHVGASGGHGAYTHLSENPVKVAAKIIENLESLVNTNVPYPDDLRRAIDEGSEAAEKALGQGGANVMSRISLNIGTIQGGLKVNMIPRDCIFEVDIRVPPGLSKNELMPIIEDLVARYPGAQLEVLRYDGPQWSPPNGEMAKLIIANARLLGFDPKPIISLGGSDLKFWRVKGVPSYYYGPTNHGMGTVDEYVEIDELINVVKVHLLSAYDYLRKS